MLKRIYQNFFLIATVLFAVLGFIHLRRLTGDAPKVADIAGLFVCTTLFGFAAISGYMEDLERKLNKWLTSARACTCTPNQGCTNCPSAGAKADQRAEAEIIGQNLTAPRVTAAQINALMDTVTWRYEQPEGTTSTFAHAFLGRFYLATGHSACVSPENFNADLGMKYAREQAEGKARDKLWELEGYKLFSSQVGAQAQ